MSKKNIVALLALIAVLVIGIFYYTKTDEVTPFQALLNKNAKEGKYHYKLDISWEVFDKVSTEVTERKGYVFTVKDKEIKGLSDIEAERQAIAKKIIEGVAAEEELTGQFNLNPVRIACSEFDEKHLSCTDGISPEAIILEK